MVKTVRQTVFFPPGLPAAPNIRSSRRKLYIYCSTLPRLLQRERGPLCMAIFLFLHIFLPLPL